jgi:transposase
MSLHPMAIPPVPAETARVARAALPKGNLYLKLRQRIGTIIYDEDFVYRVIVIVRQQCVDTSP